MFPTISIPKLHMEYRLWINELNFFKEEIKLFERHLEHIINKYTLDDVTTQVEHFQNQFICQKDVIDRLKHNLNVSERQLTSFVQQLTGMGLESIKMDNHSELRDEMIMFRKIYSELKNEFRQFESTWM